MVYQGAGGKHTYDATYRQFYIYKWVCAESLHFAHRSRGRVQL